MENVNFIENLATRLGQNASVKNVFGEPIVAGRKTIIPVAQVAFGFGGGYGEKKKKKPAPANSQAEPGDNEKGIAGEGAGGGGGLYAKAKGVYEITDEKTRFIPLHDNKPVLVAVFIGFMIRRWLLRKRKNRRYLS